MKLKGTKKTNRSATIAALLALSLSLAWSQDFAITWWTIDGGGGTSTGGVYAVSGTLGQPDAGRLTGGRFVLDGGFWGAVVLIQTEGAPRLSVTSTNGTVIISWPLPATGWVLDRTPTLSGATLPWFGVSASEYQTNEVNIFFSVQPPVGNGFYRLRKP